MNLITNFEKRVLKRSNLIQKVELFWSMNNVLEQHGVIARALCGH